MRTEAANSALPPNQGSSARVEVKRLSDNDVSRWDAFVHSCSEATFFHLAGWREVTTSVLGHDAHYLFAERSGEIVGILPLGHIRSRLFGNALISVPFCVYGGIATNDPEAREMLVKKGCDIAEEKRVDYLELRHRVHQQDGWPVKDSLYFTFRKEMDPDPEVNFRAIPRKQRAMVRKGMEAGLVGVLDDDISRFYSAYSESVRNLGTPVLPRRYFQAIKRIFGEKCEVLTVTAKDRLVASVMSFYFRDEVLPYYGGGTAIARRLKGNDFLYWDLLRRACLAGVRVFDYGRSKAGTGSFSFKKNWGFEPCPLHYEYYLVESTCVPDINPLNPKYRAFVNLWKRLPLPISQRFGPIIARNLG